MSQDPRFYESLMIGVLVLAATMLFAFPRLQHGRIEQVRRCYFWAVVVAAPLAVAFLLSRGWGFYQLYRPNTWIWIDPDFSRAVVEWGGAALIFASFSWCLHRLLRVRGINTGVAGGPAQSVAGGFSRKGAAATLAVTGGLFLAFITWEVSINALAMQRAYPWGDVPSSDRLTLWLWLSAALSFLLSAGAFCSAWLILQRKPSGRFLWLTWCVLSASYFLLVWPLGAGPAFTLRLSYATACALAFVISRGLIPKPARKNDG